MPRDSAPSYHHARPECAISLPINYIHVTIELSSICIVEWKCHVPSLGTVGNDGIPRICVVIGDWGEHANHACGKVFA